MAIIGPTYKGGITYRWNAKIEDKKNDQERWDYNLSKGVNFEGQDLSFLSPAEKYDLYRGDLNFTLTNYERRRTAIMKTIPGSKEYDPSYTIPKWEALYTP